MRIVKNEAETAAKKKSSGLEESKRKQKVSRSRQTLSIPLPRLERRPKANDEFYTPPNAIAMLLPYLPKNGVIWEAAWGKGHLAAFLRGHGFKVIGREGIDFFQGNLNCDLIVTNPPYSLKDEFLQRVYELNKPFALLLPVEALVGLKRHPLYARYGLQLLIPNRRINYISDNPDHTSANFNSAWFCWKLLPTNIQFASI